MTKPLPPPSPIRPAPCASRWRQAALGIALLCVRWTGALETTRLGSSVLSDTTTRTSEARALKPLPVQTGRGLGCSQHPTPPRP